MVVVVGRGGAGVTASARLDLGSSKRRSSVLTGEGEGATKREGVGGKASFTST